MSRPRLTPARLLLALAGLAIFGALVRVAGPRLVTSLRGAAIGWLVAAFLTTGVLTAMTSLRWSRLTGVFATGERAGLLAYYRSFLLARVLALVVPSGVADLAGRPLLHRWISGTPIAATAQGGILARVVDASLLLPMTALSLLGLASGVGETLFLALFAVTMAIWLLGYLRFTARVVALLAAALRGLEGRLAARPRVVEWARSGREALVTAAGDRGLLAEVGLLSGARYLMIGAEFVCLARAMRLDEIGWMEVLVGIPLAQGLGAVAVTPGGLGFQEGGFWGALRLLAVSPQAAGSFVLGWRLLHSAFIVLLAAVVTLAASLAGARR